MLSRFAHSSRVASQRLAPVAFKTQGLMSHMPVRFFGSAIMDMDTVLIDGSEVKFKDLVAGKKAIFITNVASE